MILHLAALALATFLIWEQARALLRFSLPPIVHALLVVGIAYALEFAPERALHVLAVASVVGVLHEFFGSPDTKPRLRLPTRKTATTRPRRVPDLP